MRLALTGLALVAAAVVRADVVYQQAHDGSGTVHVSSWVEPDGTDADMYVYDRFILPADATITSVQWRGGYTYGAPYGHVTDFRVTFYDSIAGGSEPLVNNPQLPEIYLAWYHVGSNASETPAGTFGGVDMYDYQYALPTPFSAAAGHPYWVRFEASEPVYPDWGIAGGVGPDAQHFRFSTGLAMFQFIPGDTAFTLNGTWTGGPTGCGAVPDGFRVPGLPLLVSRDATPGSVLLEWSPSCVATDTDYAVYAGTFAELTTPHAVTCSTAGATSASIAWDPGGEYFLVVPNDGVNEGSYGTDGFGRERRPAQGACFPQVLRACD